VLCFVVLRRETTVRKEGETASQLMQQITEISNHSFCKVRPDESLACPKPNLQCTGTKKDSVDYAIKLQCSSVF
jgi:hypothetical protein